MGTLVGARLLNRILILKTDGRAQIHTLRLRKQISTVKLSLWPSREVEFGQACCDDLFEPLDASFGLVDGAVDEGQSWFSGCAVGSLDRSRDFVHHLLSGNQLFCIARINIDARGAGFGAIGTAM